MQAQSLFPIWLSLMSMLVSGGPNDLLGYVSTHAYWKSKGVIVSLEQLERDLAEPKDADISRLIGQLSADDPNVREAAGARILQVGPGALPQLHQAVADPNPETSSRARELVTLLHEKANALAVRRLMAIRTLGELRNRDALPVLSPLTHSPTPLVAAYAQAAVAGIEGTSFAAPAVSVEQRLADVNLLPAKIDLIGQLAPPAGAPPMPFDRFVEQLPLTFTDARKQAIIDRAYQRIIGIADVLGDVRVDCVTIGWFTGPVNQPGYAVMVGRGQYDARSAADALRKAEVPHKVVAGMDVFMLDEDTALLLPSDTMAVLIPAESNGELPVEQTIAAIRSNAGDFQKNGDLAAIVKSVDIARPIWIATKINDGLRQVIESLAPCDAATLVAGPSGPAEHPAVELRLEATGKDPAAVKAAADGASANIRLMLEQSRQMEKDMPLMKPATRFFDSLKITAGGPKGTITGQITPAGILSFLTQWYGTRVEFEINGR
jgi:hypothetical protein